MCERILSETAESFVGKYVCFLPDGKNVGLEFLGLIVGQRYLVGSLDSERGTFSIYKEVGETKKGIKILKILFEHFVSVDLDFERIEGEVFRRAKILLKSLPLQVDTVKNRENLRILCEALCEPLALLLTELGGASFDEMKAKEVEKESEDFIDDVLVL